MQCAMLRTGEVTDMHMRIIWGKILPGQWGAFEAAFKKALEIRGEAKGLKSQWLLRDQNDPNADGPARHQFANRSKRLQTISVWRWATPTYGRGKQKAPLGSKPFAARCSGGATRRTGA